MPLLYRNRSLVDSAPLIRPLRGHLPPREGCFLGPHPAIAAQSRRAAKQGKQNSSLNHRRAAAGGGRSTTTSLHPRRSSLHQASPPNGSPGSGASAPALGSRTEPSEAGQCGRRRGKGMQQGIPCLQGVPCGMDFDPTSGTFHHWKVARPQAKFPLVPPPSSHYKSKIQLTRRSFHGGLSVLQNHCRRDPVEQGV